MLKVSRNSHVVTMGSGLINDPTYKDVCVSFLTEYPSQLKLILAIYLGQHFMSH